MIKTLAQLKRDAKSKNLYLTLVERYGKTPTEERFQGERQVIGCNTTSLKILTQDGKESYLDLPPASLVEYTDKELIIYNYGTRELNDKEKELFSIWETKRDRKQEEIDALSDGSSQYWARKNFFCNNNAEYLLGHKFEKGLMYNFNEKNVYDKKIKGEAILKYKVTLK